MNSFLLILLLATPALAQPFTVRLGVEAKPELQSTFESFLRRELRSLRDVELVETNANYDIAIVALPLASERGPVSGYAISELITYHSSPETWKQVLSPCWSNETLTGLITGAERLVTVQNHILRTIPSDALKRTAEQMIADFDTQQLEPSRKFTRDFLGLIQSRFTNSSPAKPGLDFSPQRGPRKDSTPARTNAPPKNP